MMDAVLLDTDVVSLLFKRDSRAERYRKHCTGRLLCVSFVTLAELLRWPLVRGWGPERVAALKQTIARYAVLPFDEDMCLRWAEIASRPGRPMNYHDSWIAATALAYDVPLITHNRSDFEHIAGLRILSEPEPA